MTFEGRETNQSEMDNVPIAYDYANQAWVKYGRYQECGHLGFMCNCFGKLHSDETLADNADLY